MTLEHRQPPKKKPGSPGRTGTWKPWLAEVIADRTGEFCVKHAASKGSPTGNVNTALKGMGLVRGESIEVEVHKVPDPEPREHEGGILRGPGGWDVYARPLHRGHPYGPVKCDNPKCDRVFPDRNAMLAHVDSHKGRG